MELETPKKKKIMIVLAIISGLFITEIGMCFLGNYISIHGIDAWNGFIIPISMTIGFFPIGFIELYILKITKRKNKCKILRFILSFQLVVFPIGIICIFMYNIFIGIK